MCNRDVVTSNCTFVRTNTSPLFTASPSFLFQRAIFPCAMVGDRAGMVTGVPLPAPAAVLIARPCDSDRNKTDVGKSRDRRELKHASSRMRESPATKTRAGRAIRRAGTHRNAFAPIAGLIVVNLAKFRVFTAQST